MTIKEAVAKGATYFDRFCELKRINSYTLEGPEQNFCQDYPLTSEEAEELSANLWMK